MDPHPPTTQEPKRRPRPGGRNADVTKRVLTATLALAAEHGLAALRIGCIAQKACVNKATIYRRWPTREALLADAMRMFDAQHKFEPKGDTLREELTEMICSTMGKLKAPGGRALLRLFGPEGHNPELQTLRWGYLEQKFRERTPIIHRGIARGELSPMVNAFFVLEMIYAPFIWRMQLGTRMDRGLIEHTIDAQLKGLHVYCEPNRLG